MKLLLTDSGVRNASMRAAQVDLLGKPIAEARALCILTAGYGGPGGDPEGPWRFISGQSPNPMTELGWKSVGALELTALPSIDTERWVSWFRKADALLVNGTLGVVDFSIFPHLDSPERPDKTMAEAERWAAGMQGPAYAIDAQTAIKVSDGSVEVISEGHWKLFNPASWTPT